MVERNSELICFFSCIIFRAVLKVLFLDGFRCCLLLPFLCDQDVQGRLLQAKRETEQKVAAELKLGHIWMYVDQPAKKNSYGTDSIRKT